jgi:hypothetical protein
MLTVENGAATPPTFMRKIDHFVVLADDLRTLSS